MMVALRPDDVTVSPVGGAVLSEVAIDLTTQLGVYVQVRGVAVTSTATSCTVTLGSTSITLATTAASGEVTAPLTAANLTTLGAVIGSTLTGWLQGTVADGSDTQIWRYDFSILVSDRVFRFPFDYNRAMAVFLPFAKSCSLPTGQTTHWPQILPGLLDLRDDINMQRADVKTAFLGRPGLLARPAFIYGCESMLRSAVLRTNANLQQSTMAYELGRYEKMRASILGETIVMLRDSSAFGTEGSLGESPITKPKTLNGWGGGLGGPL